MSQFRKFEAQNQSPLVYSVVFGVFLVVSLMAMPHLANAAQECVAPTSGGGNWGKVSSSLTAWSVDTDTNGNVYVTGRFQGANVDFDPGATTEIHSSAGGDDIFLSKFNSSGTHIWTKTYGGTGADGGEAHVAVDKSDNMIYVNTAYSGTITIGGTPHTSKGNNDILIFKVNSSGTVQWSGTVGKNGGDSPTDIAAAGGRVYAVGRFRKYATFSTVDLDPTTGTNNHTFMGTATSVQYDSFITSMNSNGTYRWGRLFGALDDSDIAQAVAIDNSSNVYVVGSYNNTADFNDNGNNNECSPSPDGINCFATKVAGNGDSDIFIMKLTGAGAYVRTRTIGGSGNDWAEKVDVDSSNRSVTVGTFNNTVNFDQDGSGTTNKVSSGGGDVFVTRYTATGTHSATYAFGGTGEERGMAVVADTSENNDIRVGGTFYGTVDLNFTSSGVDNRSSVPSTQQDIFVNIINADGTYRHAYTYGGTLSDSILDMAWNVNTNPDHTYTVGAFSSASIDLDMTDGVNNKTRIGTRDAYLTGIKGDYPFRGIGLRYRSSGAKSLAIQCDAVTNSSSPLRIRKSGTVYAIDLVDPAVDFASGIRVRTANDGVQAARICEENCTTRGTSF